MTAPEDVWKAAYQAALDNKATIKGKDTVAVPSVMAAVDTAWHMAIERAAEVAEKEAVVRRAEHGEFKRACAGRTAAFAEAIALDQIAAAIRSLTTPSKGE